MAFDFLKMNVPRSSWIDGPGGEIAYSVRKSRRAKRVLLTITPENGLVVTVPERVALKHIPEIIEERRTWILDTSARLADERARYLEAASAPPLPETIELRCFGERRWVVYEDTGRVAVQVEEQGPYRLLVSGGVSEEQIQQSLRRWLRHRAADELPKWLLALAAERTLTVAGTSIRSQRTRWASCSEEGRISLNSSLLFLPRRLVRFVLIHELCHLVEMNHSERYWKIVADEEPEYRTLDRELDRSWTLVPRWSRA